ncbi:porin [Thalassotalea atypica]|uniref:porin n=1 Tax=Thalassotalea atypica TaxID=2054316 RepID=UPI002573E030|nr:porin [Thalassotalea atypica]
MNKSKLAIVIGALIFSNATLASEINFSGYGSIRGGLVLDDDHYPRNFNYDDKVDFKNQSVFALQAQAQINDDWNATVVLQASGHEDFEVEARWAYLNYQLTPETIFTFGRFALPYFRHSDTQDVGFSHDYSAMPRSIYRGQDFDVIEGIRVMHSTFIGDGDITFKGSYGSFSGQTATANGDVDTELNNIVQLSAEYTYEWFSMYVGAVSAKTNVDIDDQLDYHLMSSLSGYTIDNGVAYNPNNIPVYNMSELYVDEDDALYLSTGVTFDFDQWVFNAEYATYQVEDSFSEASTSVYASLGYRFDKTTVSFVVEDQNFGEDYDSAKSSDPIVNSYLKAVNDSFARPSEYDSQGIHVRYDAFAGVAYKFEYTYATDDLEDKGASVVTFGLDFIF